MGTIKKIYIDIDIYYNVDALLLTVSYIMHRAEQLW